MPNTNEAAAFSLDAFLVTANGKRAIAIARLLLGATTDGERDAADAKLSTVLAKHVPADMLDTVRDELLARASVAEPTARQQRADNAKRAAGAAKPSKPEQPKAEPKPEAAKPAPKPVSDERAAERAAAAAAVRSYYSGSSLPFKAASDTFKPLNFDNAKAASQRQAALLAAMLAADTADNIKPDGTFIRGGFKLPARLFNPDAAADAVVSCQPESGCLGNMLGRVVSFVSGPLTGKAQRETVLRIDFDKASAEISAHLGDAIGKLALARIAALRAAA